MTTQIQIWDMTVSFHDHVIRKGMKPFPTPQPVLGK